MWVGGFGRAGALMEGDYRPQGNTPGRVQVGWLVVWVRSYRRHKSWSWGAGACWRVGAPLVGVRLEGVGWAGVKLEGVGWEAGTLVGVRRGSCYNFVVEAGWGIDNKVGEGCILVRMKSGNLGQVWQPCNFQGVLT